jgi:hypothetical protein
MALIVLGFALFCSAPSLLAYMWLHVFHVPRGIMGLNLIARMPRSHDIIGQLPLTQAHDSLETVNAAVTQSVSKIFMDYTERCKRMFLWYGLLTVLCFLFDAVEFLI